MPSPPNIIVVGSINIDYQIRAPRLPARGETVGGDRLLVMPGGKGANQAVAAARLGADVSLVARIGTDGGWLIDLLEAEGVRTNLICRDEVTKTGAALIMVDAAGEKSIMTAPGANARLAVPDIANAITRITSAHVLLVQLEIGLEVVREALTIARGVSVTTVLDPAPGCQLDDELLSLVDVVRPNSTEATILTGIDVVDRASARQAAAQLIERGAGAAVVQEGAEGNIVLTHDGECFLPRIAVDCVDATGAGDALAAALAVALSEGCSLFEAGRIASAAAALATTGVGAQDPLPTREAVERLLKGGR